MTLSSVIACGTPCGWCLSHQSILGAAQVDYRIPYTLIRGALVAICGCGRLTDSCGSCGTKRQLTGWTTRTCTLAENKAKAAYLTRISPKRRNATTGSKLEFLQGHATLTLRRSKHILPSYSWKSNAILIRVLLSHNKHIDRMFLQRLDGATSSLRRPDDKYSTKMLLLFAAVGLSTLPSNPTRVTLVALRSIPHGWCGRDEFAVDEVSSLS